MKRGSPDFFVSFKHFFRGNTGFFLLSLLLACISCPVYDMVYAPGIDGSLPWVFNYFADGHFSLGKNTVFPHGPLAFLLYPLPTGNNFFVALSVHLLCATVLGISWYKLCAQKEHPQFVPASLLLLVFLAFADLQLIICGIAASHIMLYRQNGKISHLFLLALFSVFNLYIKTYGGIICALLVAGEGARLLFAERNYKKVLQLAALYLLFFFFVWLQLYHSLSGSLTFIVGQLQLSSNNSEAVQFALQNTWWLLGCCIVSFFALYFVSDNRPERSFFLLMLLPMFAAWKHAMARSEELHMRGFMNFLLLFVFMLWLLSEGKNLKLIFLSVVSVVAFTLDLGFTQEQNAKEKTISLFRAYNLYNYMANYDTIAGLHRAQSKYYVRNQYLPDSVLKLIGNNTLDVYPWNYAIVAANRLNWVPRPVINSYACYTHWLDGRNSKHLYSENTAKFVIWEQTDIDNRGLDLESIDQRYVLNDEPQAIIDFFAGYELKLKSGRFLIYEKRNSRQPVNIKTVVEERMIEYNKWTDLPPHENSQIMRAKLTINKTLTGWLKSLFYKGEIFYIWYQLENNKVYCHRIVPKNAADGLWIDPLILHPGSSGRESSVKRIKVTCLCPEMVSATLGLSFEQIGFSNSNNDMQEYCFKKDRILPQKSIYFNVNSAANISDASLFIENLNLKKSKDEFMSAPASYILEPGEHSGFFDISIDTPETTRHVKQVRFCFEAFVKASKNCEAELLVSRDTVPNSEAVFWSSKVRDLVKENNTWTHIYFIKELPINEALRLKPLYFYISNKGSREKIYLDDLSVTVDGM